MSKTNVAGNQAAQSAENGTVSHHGTSAQTNGTNTSEEQIEAMSTGDGTDQTPDELSLDVVFDVLKNSRRRLVLDYLARNDQPVDLRDLADFVTAEENDTDVSAITSKERKRVYVGLYQFHLPKMDDMNIIEFNQDRGRISLTDRGETLVQQHAQHADGVSGGKYRYYGLALLGGLGALLGLLTGSVELATAILVLQSAILCFFISLERGVLLSIRTGFETRLPVDT